MRIGITMLFWGLILNLIGSGVLILGAVMARGDPGVIQMVYAFQLLSVIIRLLSAALCLIGAILCCTIPRASGGREWALGFLICLAIIVVLVVMFVVMVIDQSVNPRALNRALASIATLGMLMGLLTGVFMGSLCLTMVLRAAARYWRDSQLGGSFVTYFIVSWCVSVSGVVLFIAFMASAGPDLRRADAEGLILGFSCAAVIFGLVMLIWYLTLLGRLRELIPSG
jgi:hypothetical protein